jgi:FixJ family two-component response regulator
MTGAAPGSDAPTNVTVFIVDDDDALRASLRLLLETEGLTVADFDCADTFLAQCTRGCRGCVISDIHMPGISGLELQAILEERGIRLPVIMLTGQADVPAAVQSLKAGALDFLEKPFDPEALLAQVNRALALDAERHAEQAERERRQRLLARLTPREREVIERVAAGQSNKVVAIDLDISERTVELHRGRGMKKLEVRAVADLVRLLAGRVD